MEPEESIEPWRIVGNENMEVDYSVLESAKSNPVIESDSSPHAIDPKKLWPPFGLLGSPESEQALTLMTCAIPEDTRPLGEESNATVNLVSKDASSQVESHWLVCSLIKTLLSNLFWSKVKD